MNVILVMDCRTRDLELNRDHLSVVRYIWSVVDKANVSNVKEYILTVNMTASIGLGARQRKALVMSVRGKIAAELCKC